MGHFELCSVHLGLYSNINPIFMLSLVRSHPVPLNHWKFRSEQSSCLIMLVFSSLFSTLSFRALNHFDNIRPKINIELSLTLEFNQDVCDFLDETANLVMFLCCHTPHQQLNYSFIVECLSTKSNPPVWFFHLTISLNVHLKFEE